MSKLKRINIASAAVTLAMNGDHVVIVCADRHMAALTFGYVGRQRQGLVFGVRHKDKYLFANDGGGSIKVVLIKEQTSKTLAYADAVLYAIDTKDADNAPR